MAEDFSSMLFHDAVANAEAQARPFSNFLGGEKWIENLFRLGDSVSVVAERYFDGVPGLGRENLDPRRAPYVMHRVVSVVQNIEKNLLQLVRIPHDIRQTLIQVLHNFHAVIREIVGAQLNRAPQN